MTRPKISIYIAASIDGYIARKDHSLDWLDRVGGFDEDYGFKKHLDSIDTLIIGRKTYEIATTVPDPYPGKRVVVLSNMLSSVKEGMELYRGSLEKLIEQLHLEGACHIWIDGGTTISQFLNLELVDHMTIGVIPIILGEGLPLFNVVGKEIPFRLTSSYSYPSGLVQLDYEVIKKFTSPKDNIHFKIIDFGSDDYEKSVLLREAILYKPLGLSVNREELEIEKDHIHIAGFLGQELCAAAALVPVGNTVKMQRVAIKPSFQNKGLGSLMIAFCEKHARDQGFRSIYCHARQTAISFYSKSQYVCEEEPFDEVGIPHRKMRKILL